MKCLFSLAVLLSVAFGTSATAQIDGTGTLTGRHAVQSADNDDSGVLPLTMATPFGPAFLLVHESGWAMLAIPSIGISFHGLLDAIPLPPGMQGATVGGGMCKVTISDDGQGGYVSVFTPIVGGGGGSTMSLGQAVADYKAQVKEAGNSAVPCEPGQG